MPPEQTPIPQPTEKQPFNFLETDPKRNFAPWFLIFCAVLIIAGLSIAGYFKYQAYQNYKAGMEVIEVTQELSIEQKLLRQGIILPPDPGEAGKTTLEGIDSDNDGVRDDVQRWVLLTYSDTPRIIPPLQQLARINFEMLTDKSNSKSTMIALANKRGDALHCLAATINGDKPLSAMSESLREQYKINSILEELITNIPDRKSAFDRTNKLLSGTSDTMTNPALWASYCK